MNDFNEYLAKFNIKGNNQELYALALTHPSYNVNTNSKFMDYERLEFMGDAVLGFVAADLIYKHYPLMDQGLMTKLRINLVRSESLAKYARKVELADYIRTGQSVSRHQLNQSNKILEDVFEAVIGALYLDLGMEVAYNYISFFLKEDILNTNEDDLTDAKTKLQEEMQAEHRDSVTYRLVDSYGPAHDKTFVVEVLFNDVVLASGKGKSKKAAEEAAAKEALKKRIK